MDRQRVILVAGGDVPLALLSAAGLNPVLLSADRDAPTPYADDHGLTQTMGWRARSLLQQIADHGGAAAGLVLSHEDAVLPQLFATLRELPDLGRDGDNTFFLDLLHRDRPDTRRYNRRQLDAFAIWAARLGSRFTDADLLDALVREPSALVAGECLVGSGVAFAARPVQPDPWDTLLDRAASHAGGSFMGLDRFEARLSETLSAGGVSALVHRVEPEDEAAPWTRRSARAIAVTAGIDFRTEDAPAVVPLVPAAPAAPRAAPRSRKTLTSVAAFNDYQRRWFAGVRERVATGEPFAVVNANAPQELLQALEIPFVVNQWWASIVAAKQQSDRYAALLRANDLPDAVEAYSSQGLAAVFDDDPEQAPWAGLPRPTMLHALLDSDATRGLFDRWARETGAERYFYDRTIERRWSLPVAWWDSLHDDWESVLETDRLDLLENQLLEAARRIETSTGRRLSPERLETVLSLVNEQEDYYRRTRDLIAAARHVPVGIVDTMPATMVPQWHRGTEWARDAARAFHDEVAGLVEAGHAAVPDERLRLMWVGRGLWSRMGFYQQWEASHGAVFVWSMYLGLAADGYIRRYTRADQAMRSLAARFVTMGDELRNPTWAGAWHLKEARAHRVDAAIALADADPLVLAKLSTAGIPVLSLPTSNFAAGGWETNETLVSAFLDELGEKRA